MTTPRLRHNILANYAGAGWAALMSFIFVPWTIKYLGIEAYGIIGFFASIQALLYLLDMGSSTTFSRGGLTGRQTEYGPNPAKSILISLEDKPILSLSLT